MARTKLRAGTARAAEEMSRCSFRTVIGRNIPPGSTFESIHHRIGAAIAVVGGDPEPLQPDILQSLIDVLHRGLVVLVLSDRADLRDRAKQEILSMAGPATGHA